MQLTPHFSLDEMTVSQTAVRQGLSNQPSLEEIHNLRRLCLHVLEPLRKHLGPVVVTSGYRSLVVNTRVGGSSTSQHVKGLAADIIVPKHSVAMVVAAIRQLNLPFDQLIDEFGSWTHVSWTAQPRGEVLRARRNERGTTVYTRIR